MKTLLLGLALIMSAAAHAETITLETPAAGFGNLDQFHDVPTDAGIAVSFYYPDALILDTLGSPVSYARIDNAHFVNVNDPLDVIAFFFTQTSYRYRLSGSGRTGYRWVTRWTLTSGVIER